MTISATGARTTDLPSLQKQLQALGISAPIPTWKGTDVLTNPVDIYRSYLADALGSLLDCERQLVYDSIQWTNNLPNGDLLLVVPKLRLKGAKPADVARDLSQRVQ